jgi:hypothetical protein
MSRLEHSGAGTPGRDPATRAAIGWALQQIESGGQLDDAFVDAEVELVLDGGGTLRLRCERCCWAPGDSRCMSSTGRQRSLRAGGRAGGRAP